MASRILNSANQFILATSECIAGNLPHAVRLQVENTVGLGVDRILYRVIQFGAALKAFDLAVKVVYVAVPVFCVCALPAKLCQRYRHFVPWAAEFADLVEDVMRSRANAAWTAVEPYFLDWQRQQVMQGILQGAEAPVEEIGIEPVDLFPIETEELEPLPGWDQCAFMGTEIPPSYQISIRECLYDIRFFIKGMFDFQRPISPYTKDPLTDEEFADFCALLQIDPSAFNAIWPEALVTVEARSVDVNRIILYQYDLDCREKLGALLQQIYQAYQLSQITGDPTAYNQLREDGLQIVEEVPPPKALKVDLLREVRALKLLLLFNHHSQRFVDDFRRSLLPTLSPVTARFLRLSPLPLSFLNYGGS